MIGRFVFVVFSEWSIEVASQFMGRLGLELNVSKEEGQKIKKTPARASS